jgi:hypothetical protein
MNSNILRHVRNGFPGDLTLQHKTERKANSSKLLEWFEAEGEAFL